MAIVSTVPPPLASAADFKRFFPALCQQGVGADPLAVEQLMVEATAAIEDAVDRRLAPFTNVVESHRLYGIDPDEYGASTDSPLDIYGSLGMSQAAAYQSDNLVRKFWLDQAAPHYTELWTYSITSITLHLTFGSLISVDTGSLEGPYPDTGEARMRLGTFAPEGTNMEVVYSGGFTVAIPPSLQRLCRYQAAKMLMLDKEPQLRKEMNFDEIEKQIDKLMSAWARS
jgi:hypothetical protein